MTNGEQDPEMFTDTLNKMCRQGLLEYEKIVHDIEEAKIRKDGTRVIRLREGSEINSIPCKALQEVEKPCEFTNYKEGVDNRSPIMYLNCPKACTYGALFKKLTSENTENE